MEKVSSTEKATSSSSPSNSANLVNRIGYHNPTWGGDEDVDEKATIYISYVRKLPGNRFILALYKASDTDTMTRNVDLAQMSDTDSGRCWGSPPLL
ncbi:hypothetical protein V6N11_021474 [Hibiscus sabdariffa]|uniref:Uncharacterized protein n=1 Tax=Hibiscus sabdariffa TaxID=183260 RepID=A0ABR1ZDC3_9ROSI